MKEDQDHWDGLDPWSEAETTPPEPLAGGAEFEYPRNARRGLKVVIAIPTFFIIVHVLLLAGPLRGEGPIGIIAGILLILFFIGLAIYMARSYTYIIIYPDRVVISRASYDKSDIRWLDIYEVEDVSGYTQVGGATMPHFDEYFEMVVSVWTPAGTKAYTFHNRDSELDLTYLISRFEQLLPNLQVKRHLGVEDRTGGPFWLFLNAMGR
jgi:hypothetical protein